MARIVIDSLDDPRLRPYRDLNHRSTTCRGDRFIAEGRLVVERLLASDHRCESVLVEAGRHHDFADSLDPSTDVLHIQPQDIRRLVGFDFHRGILACGVRQPAKSIAALPLPTGDAPLVIACGVTDAENLGSLIRSSAAFGVERLVITPDTADPLSRRTLRVSMGAALRLEIFTSERPAEDLRWLSDKLDYRVIATTLAPDAQPLDQFTADGRPVAIIMGSEAKGLPEQIARAATDRVTIPMRQGIDSLNVAVAAAITLYEVAGSR